MVTKKYYEEKYNDRLYEKDSSLEIYREDVVRWLPQGRLQSLSFIPFAMRRVLWLNKKYGIDVIEAHCVYTGIAASLAGRMLRKPVVWMAHGTDEAYGKIQGITETLITRIFRPDHLVVLDDGSRAPEKFRHILGESKVTMVYHGIDTDFFNPQYYNEALKKSLGLQNDFVVSITSLLIPVKNVDLAISSFAKFLKSADIKNAALLIIGDGPLETELRAMVEELGLTGNVKFIGKIVHRNVRDYLSFSDIVMATSLHSNVNRSTLEAMSSGKTILAFDSGNTKRVYTHMRDSLLAKAGDVEDLADKLLLAYRHPELRKHLGKNAREFVVKNRGWEKRVRTELTVFESIAANDG
jgi:glycosyltransferase involved in cell wall biosynthesis